MSRAKEIGAVLLVVLPLFVPELALAPTPLNVDAGFAIAGILPALIGWMFAPRYAFASLPVAAILNGLAVLVFGNVLATTIFVGAVALLVGVSALRGLHPIAAFAAIQPAIVVISGYSTVSIGQFRPDVVGQALICAGVALFGGLWAVVIGVVLLRRQSSGAPDPVPAPIAGFYTGALLLLLVPLAFIASRWFSGSSAGWVLLTVLLVLRPTYAESKFMVGERALGTIVGVAIAAVIAVIVPNTTVLVVLGIIAMIVAAALQIQHARYAYFAAFVTLAIVLLDAQRRDVFTVDILRLAYTIIGVLLVAGVVSAASMLLSRFRPTVEERDGLRTEENPHNGS